MRVPKEELILCMFVLSGCASQWKIQGGPEECRAMCKNWELDFVAMVGVGNQGSVGPGATACVCQVKKVNEHISSVDNSASSVASLAGPITAEQAAVAAHAALQQQQMMQYRSSGLD